MKQFEFRRFAAVARWDLSVNSKFYTRSAILMMVFISTPIVLFYLYNMLFNGMLLDGNTSDNVEDFDWILVRIGSAYAIISSGYMFHNLLTRQGRISELTLPATNLERFLWHVAVIVIGVPLVFFCGVVVADFLHFLFRLTIANADIQSLTAMYYWADMEEFGYDARIMSLWNNYGYEISLAVYIWMGCYLRSFSLFNAWKYRYNIPLTLLFYFLLWTILPLVMLFFVTIFISEEQLSAFMAWLADGDWHTYLVYADIIGILILVGIWLLTYRLYAHAQLTTKRNP